MEENYKRINVLIRPDQYRNVTQRHLSLSGLIRDLLDDRFGDTKITLAVNKQTKELYDYIVSNFGISDFELEKHIVEALDKALSEKSEEIAQLRDKLHKL